MPRAPRLIDDYIPGQPDSAQFGSIRCNHSPGPAVLTNVTDRAFATHTYRNMSTSNCAVTIDTARLVPATPPVAPVPEPATWLMMIAGFGASARPTQAANHAPVIGPSMTSGAVMPESRSPDERGRLPVPVRHGHAQPFAAWRTVTSIAGAAAAGSDPNTSDGPPGAAGTATG